MLLKSLDQQVRHWRQLSAPEGTDEFAVAGGLISGLSLDATIAAFNEGLGGGATVALSYATLGAFAVAIGKSGLAHALADKALNLVGRQDDGKAAGGIRLLIVGLLLAIAMSSQNILPIHIAFIPLVVPPLLYVMAKLNMDRRLVACVLTFGLITPYMFLPVGFGGIYLNEILLAGLKEEVPEQASFGLFATESGNMPADAVDELNFPSKAGDEENGVDGVKQFMRKFHVRCRR